MKTCVSVQSFKGGETQRTKVTLEREGLRACCFIMFHTTMAGQIVRPGERSSTNRTKKPAQTFCGFIKPTTMQMTLTFHVILKSVSVGKFDITTRRTLQVFLVHVKGKSTFLEKMYGSLQGQEHDSRIKKKL